MQYISTDGIRRYIGEEYVNSMILKDQKEVALSMIRSIKKLDFSVLKKLSSSELNFYLKDFDDIELHDNNKVIVFKIKDIQYNSVITTIKNTHQISFSVNSRKLKSYKIFSTVQDNHRRFEVDNYEFFYMIPGDEKFLISGTWVDRISIEEDAFQQSTVSNELFDLAYVHEIIKEFGEFI